ncbi:MAG: methane monooxygenase/ammonia monooxygenase subunit B [Methylocystaceae bacterium]|nr:MAG: methane monooxygenase/ammonia monooxygenase subunit B [Methylocystaceae bacterium]
MKSSVLETLAKCVRARALRIWAFGLAAAVAATTLPAATPASAHGERSQQAFLRMRTLNWYDVKWSKTTVNVNEEMELTGKVHVFSGWPQAVAKPEVAFLNVGEPGPVLIRKGAFVGDVPAPRSFSLQVGKDYEYKLVLKARRQGRFHVHVQINVEGGGPIVGPGQWIDIKGDMANFTNPVTLLDGSTIDLESYGITWVYTYHFLWMAAAAVWILYWFMTKGIIVRYWQVKAGKGNDLISTNEKKFGGLWLAGTLLAVLFGYAWANSTWPRTLPMQAGLLKGIDPIPLPPQTVTAHFKGGSYTVPGRELAIKLKITNSGSEAVKVGEFTTAGLRFLNPEVFTTKPEFPDYLLADRGLSVSDPTPIAPGETRDVTVIVQDARFDIERLSDLAYDTDSQFGGLLFFFSPSGQRQGVEIGGPVIPKFQAGATL